MATNRKPAPKPPARKTTRASASRAVQVVLQAPLTRRIVARYDAAGMGRRMRGWVPPTSGPNNAIRDIQKIRDRGRDAVRNEWSARSAATRWATNLVGTGIVPRLSQAIEKTRRDEIMQLWNRWTNVCDADGAVTFYGLQRLATVCWLVGGEVFPRLRFRRADSPLPVPLQVQLIEADQVPMLDSDYWPGLPKGNTIRSGIERTMYGQRVAVWVYKEHPSDNKGWLNDPMTMVRVPISDMLHIYEPERPGQLRGVPDNAAVLARLRGIADFDDAVLERQKIANLFTTFITKAAATGGFLSGVDPLTMQPIQTDSGGSPMVGLEPGMSIELAPGEDVKFANPPEAGTTYADYMRSQHLGTAAGQGLPYELMSGDILNVSDRTLRLIINEFRRFAEQRQWQIIIPRMCQPIFEAWVDQAVLGGEIAVREAPLVKRATWAPQGWAYMHPVQDVQAKQLEVANGFRSRSSVIAERGDDPEEVDNERKADKDREDSLGLQPVVKSVAAPQTGPDGSGQPQQQQQ